MCWPFCDMTAPFNIKGWYSERYCKIPWSILNEIHKIWIINNHRKLDKIMSIFSVSTVPGNGLTPLGATTSAGTVMTIYKTSAWRAELDWRYNNYLMHLRKPYSFNRERERPMDFKYFWTNKIDKNLWGSLFDLSTISKNNNNKRKKSYNSTLHTQ